jgi:hypothetical protein
MHFQWFDSRGSYEDALAATDEDQRRIEEAISSLETLSGYCLVCAGLRDFRVDVGVRFGEQPSLRDGLRCMTCGSSGRERLVLWALEQRMAAEAESRGLTVFERLTPFFEILLKRYPGTHGSEFVDPCLEPGEVVELRGTKVRHESLVSLSAPDESERCLLHCDVLEHVSDHEKALAECARVLCPGGQLFFTAPFFSTLDRSERRASIMPDGSVEHLMPPEMHGDPIRTEGALAFHHFGWSLLDDCRAAGFARVELGLCVDPFQGMLATCTHYEYCRMQPIVFLCTR